MRSSMPACRSDGSSDRISRPVGQVHQNQPPDHRVKLARRDDVTELALNERNVGQPHGPSQRPRERQGLGIPVDANDLARRADVVGGEEGDVARAAAKVEDTHAVSDPGLDEDPPRQRPEDLALAHQARQLRIGVAEQVVVVSC
jgi:hypothetical protein